MRSIDYKGYSIVENAFNIVYDHNNIGRFSFFTVEVETSNSKRVFFKADESGWKTLAAAKRAITRGQLPLCLVCPR